LQNTLKLTQSDSKYSEMFLEVAIPRKKEQMLNIFGSGQYEASA
jgi:hypothetical protein